MTHAVSFLADFKLGHYMKIPPRAMFHAQVLSLNILHLPGPVLFYNLYKLNSSPDRSKIIDVRHHSKACSKLSS